MDNPKLLKKIEFFINDGKIMEYSYKSLKLGEIIEQIKLPGRAGERE